jgi:HEAT repeat protein
VREAAALALGVLRDRRGVEPLLGAVKDESSWVREKSATALGMIRDPRADKALAGALVDQAPEVGDAALRALAMLDDRENRAALLGQIQAAPVGLRYRASYWVAMFSLGWRPRTCEDCVRLLAALDHRLLLVALGPATGKTLLADAAMGDAATVQTVAELLIAVGREESVGDLVALLNGKGSKALAAAYAHCGKKELLEAAESWARQHRRLPLPAPSPGADVRWGGL